METHDYKHVHEDLEAVRRVSVAIPIMLGLLAAGAAGVMVSSLVSWAPVVAVAMAAGAFAGYVNGRRMIAGVDDGLDSVRDVLEARVAEQELDAARKDQSADR